MIREHAGLILRIPPSLFAQTSEMSKSTIFVLGPGDLPIWSSESRNGNRNQTLLQLQRFSTPSWGPSSLPKEIAEIWSPLACLQPGRDPRVAQGMKPGYSQSRAWQLLHNFRGFCAKYRLWASQKIVNGRFPTTSLVGIKSDRWLCFQTSCQVPGLLETWRQKLRGGAKRQPCKRPRTGVFLPSHGFTLSREKTRGRWYPGSPDARKAAAGRSGLSSSGRSVPTNWSFQPKTIEICTRCNWPPVSRIDSAWLSRFWTRQVCSSLVVQRWKRSRERCWFPVPPWARSLRSWLYREQA